MSVSHSETDPKMDALQVWLLREVPAWRKLDMLTQLNKSACLLALSGHVSVTLRPKMANFIAGWRVGHIKPFMCALETGKQVLRLIFAGKFRSLGY